jgi:DNA recombination protein RmuC
VIDSKVSLNAYEEALAAEDDKRRETKLKQHLANLRNHVKQLSEQDYDKLNDVRSLDFVLLFIPIESAFTLAMELDHKLFTEAFAKRIVIVSPTTLMMTLRIINNVWRYEKQNRNAQEIARRAGALYDKLRVLVEQMETLGKQLHTAEKTYTNIYAGLAAGKGNLVRQVEKFRELGAQVKKPMSPALIDKAADED